MASKTPAEWAQEYAAAGLSVITLGTDKTPIGKWKIAQTVRLAPEAVAAHWKNAPGIGIICGAVSGNLEVIDIDRDGILEPFKDLAIEALGQEFWDSLSIAKTPTPGRFHILYKCEAVGPNTELAHDLVPDPDRPGEMKPSAKIETRGEGGYVVAVGSSPSCHPLNRPYTFLQGSYFTIPTITVEQRRVLFKIARSFTEYVKPELQERAPRKTNETGKRTGDLFNGTASWQEILEPHGWQLRFTRADGTAVWRRPGKTIGSPSATTNFGDSDLLYVFTSSGYPFEAGRAYDKFGAYTRLNFGGDFNAATKDLIDKGFIPDESEAYVSPVEQSPEDWPDPLPVDNMKLPVTKMTDDLLPPKQRDWLADIAHRMQCPLDYPAVTAVVAMSSLIGSRCGVRPKQKDNWTVTPNLWGAVVGPPGAKKTPAMNAVLKLLSEMEAAFMDENDKNEQKYKVDLEIFLEQKKAINDRIRSAARGDTGQKRNGKYSRNGDYNNDND
jgi:hypothetical protein